MAEITTLTEKTATDLIDLLRRDRASRGGGPARVGNGVLNNVLVTRWGKTSVTPDYPTYPTSGNVVGVTLGDYEPSPLYPGSTATKTFTPFDPPDYLYATLENGSIPAVGTVVRLTWRNGWWWILQESSAAPQCYFKGVRLYRPTGGYRASRDILYSESPGSVYWTDSIGDVSGCNITMNTSSAAAYTDYAMKVTVAGWYEFHWNISVYDATADVDKAKYTATTEAGGAQGTHTHAINLGSAIATTTGTPDTHNHGGAVASDGSHTHTMNLNAYVTDGGGSFGTHTHTVYVPNGRDGISSFASIKWRPSGGAEGDWDLIATAVAQMRDWPCLNQAYLGTYGSCSPRGLIYLAANTEIVFRVTCNAPAASASQYDDANCQVVGDASYTNLKVTYHGASVSTASHYP